jgi:hypothetical protein
MTHSTVTVQTTPESRPSTPGWMGEVAAFAQILTQTGILAAITERFRFARARMGTYELIDFLVVLIGYALSGEPTRRAFYDRLLPFADVFMALFGRSRLPSRSALSRFLAALDQASVENLRTLFQEDLLARTPFVDPGGITDRCEGSWLVADVDGTRQAARQRALPLEPLKISPTAKPGPLDVVAYETRLGEIWASPYEALDEVFLVDEVGVPESLKRLLFGQIKSKLIIEQWEEMRRVASSIRHGTVSASLLMRPAY